MLCLACGEFSSTAVCTGCRSTLRPAPDAVIDSGLLVRAGFSHIGAAVRLVHRLKYEGVVRSADILARVMLPLLPAGGAALVPIPRSLPRRLRYGVDPGRELAMALRRHSGLPVVDCLVPGLVHRANAGRRREGRQDPRLVLRYDPPTGGVLIDDVLTTGMTLGAAHGLLGPAVLGAITATRAVARVGNRGAAVGSGILTQNGRIN